MAKAKAKKKTDIENELIKHSDLISDAKVKQFIERKKDEKLVIQRAKERKAMGSKANIMTISEDVDMVSSEEDEDK